jgi:hypothetical protein
MDSLLSHYPNIRTMITKQQPVIFVGFGFHGVANCDALLSTSGSERFTFSIGGSEESRPWLVGPGRCVLTFSIVVTLEFSCYIFLESSRDEDFHLV